MAQIGIVVPSPVYIEGGGKIGEITDGTVDLTSGAELVQTDGGTYVLMGRGSAKVTFKTIVPRKGMKYNAFKATIDKKIVNVRIPLNGQFLNVTGVFQSASANWQMQNGSCTGDFTIIGPEPTLT